MTKKIVHKILSNKMTTGIIAILVLAIIIPSLYVLYGIHKSVQKMAAATESPTYFPDYPAVNLQNQDPNLIKVGEYLVKAGDCIACHTNTQAKGKAFAGGLAMPTPFGTIYSPNITPDKKTGIGNWTQTQFIKAMRKGISPDGHYYYPAFPYPYFARVTDKDLIAIKAYLDSIPAVEQANRKNEMIWPFNYRFLQLGWRILFFHQRYSSVFKPDPKQSDEWNRGAYLVEGLGHCAMCHSPSYHLLSQAIPLGAPIRKYSLTGSKIQGYLAPNITEANLATISDEEVVEVFSKDKLIGGGAVEGPMLEVNHDSLRYLPQADLLAITTYLKSVQSQTPPKPSGGAIGQGLYDAYCSGCHATGSGGAPKYGDATAWAPIIKSGMTSVYDKAIKGYAGMPAKGTCISCSDDEIKQSVDYMIAAIQGGGTVAVSTPKPQKLTLADGKNVYEQNCSVCHKSGFNGAPKPGDKLTWQPIINHGFLETYADVVSGNKGHPPRGACVKCSDAELKAAVKYMMTVSSTDKNYDLW